MQDHLFTLSISIPAWLFHFCQDYSPIHSLFSFTSLTHVDGLAEWHGEEGECWMTDWITSTYEKCYSICVYVCGGRDYFCRSSCLEWKKGEVKGEVEGIVALIVVKSRSERMAWRWKKQVPSIHSFNFWHNLWPPKQESKTAVNKLLVLFSSNV